VFAAVVLKGKLKPTVGVVTADDRMDERCGSIFRSFSAVVE